MRVARAIAFVVGLEFGTQAPRFDADDRFDARIVVGFAVEDFDADHVLLQAGRLAGKGLLHDEPQKSSHAIGAGEQRARQDLFQLLPYRGGLKRGLADLRHC